MVRPALPPELVAAINRVDELSRWERSELGRSLRTVGWTYAEIASVIPVARSTIAGWCREIELTDDQVAAIRHRTGSVRGVPRDTQRRRREERDRIQQRAEASVGRRMADPDWLAGTVLYWAEGFKTENRLGMANSDPAVLRVFISWCRRHHYGEAQFSAKLNLHQDNDEIAARAYWAAALQIDLSDFRKTFIKPRGTGHRKNHLPHGVAQVRMRRSTDAFVRTMGWIEGLRANWQECLDVVYHP